MNIPPNPTIIREMLEWLREQIDDLRKDYATMLSLKQMSVFPERYDQLLETITVSANNLKQEIKDVTNGTHTIELPH